MESDQVCELLDSAGCKIEPLKQDLGAYLQTKIPLRADFAENPEKNPLETLGFQSVMNRAVFHCVSSSRTIVDVPDVLVSMLDEKKNYCSYFLLRNGTERMKLLEIISRMKNAAEAIEQENYRNSPMFDSSNPAGKGRNSALENFVLI